jgi:hypothetical protein
LVTTSSSEGSSLILAIALILIIRAESSNVSFPLADKAFVFVAELPLFIFTESDIVTLHMDGVDTRSKLLVVIVTSIGINSFVVVVVATDVKLRCFVLKLM